MDVLGIFPHPDDESYAAGGLLASAVRDGFRAHVVCATRGGAGTDLGGATRAGESLQDCRTRELHEACEAMGVQAPQFLDWPDGGVADIDPAHRDQAVAALLAELQPELVITLGRDGVYGHPDHLAVTDTVVRVAKAATIRVALAVFPRHLFRPLHRQLARWGVPLRGDGEDLGVDPGVVETKIEMAPVMEHKRAAMLAHRSQRKGDELESFLGRDIVEFALANEWFVSP